MTATEADEQLKKITDQLADDIRDVIVPCDTGRDVQIMYSSLMDDDAFRTGTVDITQPANTIREFVASWPKVEAVIRPGRIDNRDDGYRLTYRFRIESYSFPLPNVRHQRSSIGTHAMVDSLIFWNPSVLMNELGFVITCQLP